MAARRPPHRCTSPAAPPRTPRGDIFIADSGDSVVREVTAAGVINRIAGTSTAGLGKGAAATHSDLDRPQNVAVDAQGDVFIADTYNNRVVKVTPKGKASTVAGNGTAGYAGDGGPATSARLNDSQGVAVDGAGDLFIADTFNNAVREVTPAGTISTVVNAAPAADGTPPAGGETNNAAPTASKLNTPYGIAIDPSTNNLYVADTHNSKIAQVTGLAQPGDAAGPTAPASA